jgi:hypothetical protein
MGSKRDMRGLEPKPDRMTGRRLICSGPPGPGVRALSRGEWVDSGPRGEGRQRRAHPARHSALTLRSQDAFTGVPILPGKRRIAPAFEESIAGLRMGLSSVVFVQR